LTSGPLTTLSLRNIASGERFAIPIENEQGWFAAQLPPGTYASGMQYYIWIFDTPARIQVPSDRERCYLGTLDVNLFVQRTDGRAPPEARFRSTTSTSPSRTKSPPRQRTPARSQAAR
jgi:hypothetical protein